MDNISEKVDEFEDKALERANKATMLLKNRKDFHDVYEALKATNKTDFINICKHAGIDDAQLIEDMWNAWLKLSEKRFKSAGPIW